jgi:hypothetical protein
MKKLRLKLEALAVESFPTVVLEAETRGTVEAAEGSRGTLCATCDGASCGGTSCGGGPPYCTCYPYP